jgi:hypothetical protein
VRPDLILFDHSPTAMLASRAFGDDVRRAVIGSGFCVPPDLPDPPLLLRRWLATDPGRLKADEAAVLGTLNTLLAEWHRPPIERVAQLYSDVDEQLLVTFAELDHFAERGRCLHRRGGARAASPKYRGPWTEGRGRPPQWPDVPAGGGRKRVFGYLKNIASLPLLLDALRSGGHPAIVYADGVPPATRFFASDTLRIETSPVHFGRAVRECDLAVLSSGHGATAAALLAGKPALLLPTYLEQSMLCEAAARNTGAVVETSPKDGAKAVEALESMLATDRYAEAARKFAARYAGFDAARENERMVDRIEQLVGRAPPAATAPLIGLAGAPFARVL